jgi:hypothetical protein
VPDVSSDQTFGATGYRRCEVDFVIRIVQADSAGSTIEDYLLEPVRKGEHGWMIGFVLGPGADCPTFV